MRKRNACHRPVLNRHAIFNTLFGILVELLWVAFLIGIAGLLTAIFFKAR